MGMGMIFCSHIPDRDSTPCFRLEQVSRPKSQHGLVRVELGARDCARVYASSGQSKGPKSTGYNCRMIILILVLLTAAAALACSGDPAPQPTAPEPTPTAQTALVEATTVAATVSLAPAFGGLTFERPVALAFPGDDNDRSLVVEQPGRVLLLTGEGDTWSATEFLDITDRVNDGGNEEGLLGLALDTDFESNGVFYVYYTASGPRRSVISRFTVTDDDPDLADAESEKIIIEAPQPYANHNGGQILFGPEGFLYVGLGDGGSAGDPRGNGQDAGTLLGSILRIDVSASGAGGTYAVPVDNPFVGVQGARPEIWAYGLRNPWRFTFDRLTGELWAADVGQNSLEEVDVIVPGGNYGWNIMEGSECFRLRGGGCDSEGLEPPVVEYGRDDGCSITGGYVYRGSRLPGLYGRYMFADYCSGKIWAFSRESEDMDEFMDTDHSISSFGEDGDGELYVISLDGGIYRLTE